MGIESSLRNVDGSSQDWLLNALWRWSIQLNSDALRQNVYHCVQIVPAIGGLPIKNP
jgi:hypothetical protein